MISDLVQKRLDSLTKPPGSLGRMEELIVRYAQIRGAEPPRQLRATAYVFCADHGVVAEGVSAWPGEVTRQMALNFVSGGAAINVLCRQAGIDPFIVDMGVLGGPVPGALNRRIAPGTRNFAREPAMTAEQALGAIETGRQLASRDHDLILCGDMGIGNTTAATALLCAYAGCDPAEVTGAGAGLDDAGIRHKSEVIRRALALHPSREPLDVAACFGGFEILAIAGLILGSASVRVPVVMDGFITCSAALIVKALEPAALDAVLYSHRSAERGHRVMLEFLGARPLLDLDLRLGEGSGAVLALLLIQAAFRLYHEMATFDQASVSRND